MDRVTARITQLCERRKPGTIGMEWPAIAAAAIHRDDRLEQFLERLLTAESEAASGARERSC